MNLHPTSISLFATPYELIEPCGDSVSFLSLHPRRSEVTVDGSYQAEIVVSLIILDSNIEVSYSSAGFIWFRFRV